MEDSSAYIGVWASWQVTWIFVQYGLSEELTSPLGCLCSEGTSVNPPKSASSVGPLIRVVVWWFGQANGSSDGRKDECWRAKCLVRVDSEFIVQSQSRIRHRRRYGAHWSHSVWSIWRGLSLAFLRGRILYTLK